MNEITKKQLALWKDGELSKTTIPISGLISCLRNEKISPHTQMECLKLVITIFQESLVVPDENSMRKKESYYFASNIANRYPELQDWKSRFESGRFDGNDLIIFYEELLNNWEQYHNDNFLLRNLDVFIWRYCVLKLGKSCADYYDNAEAVINKSGLLRKDKKCERD